MKQLNGAFSILFNLLLVCTPWMAAAQKLDAVPQQALKDSAAQGIPLTTDLNVNDKVTAQAVLLPYAITKRVFGNDIATRYAAIEVNIANKSRDADFILHGLFLDYSNWALSGYVTTLTELKSKDTQSPTESSQVASVEYRLVRSQLQDAQLWTARNWTVRLLTLAGSIATGFTFSFKEVGIGKGIAAFGGTVVPGVATAWPDNTVSQLNNISDFGYRTNKVFTKEQGEIMVAFFPIDRFLTPALRRIFLQSPALFFNPFSMFYDHKALLKFQQAAPGVIETEDVPRMLKALPTYRLKEPLVKGPEDVEKLKFTEYELKLLYLSRTSLNTIRVVVDGIMTVDVQSIPAKIDTIAIDNAEKADTWSKAGDVTGTIQGTFLGSGAIAIAEADALGISKITADPKTSSDQQMKFTMTLAKAIDPGKTLTFRVSKTDKAGHTVESSPFPVKVQYDVGAPSVEAPAGSVHAGDTISIKGSGFVDPATVMIGKDTVAKTDVTIKSATELSVKVPKLDPGDYDLTVKTSGGASKAVKLTITAGSGTPPKNDGSAGGGTPAAADDPNQPLVLRVKYANGKPGARSAGFLVIGDKLDKIDNVRGPAALVIRGFQPSPDGLYLDVGVAVPSTTKPGTYQVQLLDAAGKVVKEIDYKVD